MSIHPYVLGQHVVGVVGQRVVDGAVRLDDVGTICVAQSHGCPSVLRQLEFFVGLELDIDRCIGTEEVLVFLTHEPRGWQTRHVEVGVVVIGTFHGGLIMHEEQVARYCVA